MQFIILLISCSLIPVYCHNHDISKKIKNRRLRFRPSVIVDTHETSDQSGEFVEDPSASITLQHACNKDQKESKFRSADGSCNNLKHPSWGQAGAPYIRMIEDHYDDDKSVPRQTSDSGDLLPSARRICQEVFNGHSHPSYKLTQMTMQWGQFLDHDLDSTPVENVNRKACCEGISKESYFTGEDCFPIYMEDGDSFFTSNCMGFVRSQRFEGNTAYDKRQQFNTITSFIDGSMIYGSSEDEVLMLRAGEDGLMSTNDLADGKSFLPEDETPGACRNQDDPDAFCFLAGDARVNVVPGLQALHTLFVRFHNKMAKELKTIGDVKQIFQLSKSTPLSDEMIFQTARKIVSAVIQRITYKEYIPSAFGREFVRQFKLDKPHHYKTSINPQIINAFTTAAYRYGHSLIPDSMNLNGHDVPYHELFLNTKPLLHNFSQVINSVISDPSEMGDRSLSVEMMDRLFETSKGSVDIVSLNIQRGRDHGLPSYAEYREICHLPPVRNFRDFGDCSESLSNVYKRPEDVDLFVGGLCEKPIPDSQVGPTFACIIGTQFYTLKNGDRFFYTTRDKNLGFTRKQLSFIDDITLGRLLCEFGEIDSVQKNVFFAPSRRNPKEKCQVKAVPWTRALYDF